MTSKRRRSVVVSPSFWIHGFSGLLTAVVSGWAIWLGPGSPFVTVPLPVVAGALGVASLRLASARVPWASTRSGWSTSSHLGVSAERRFALSYHRTRTVIPHGRALSARPRIPCLPLLDSIAGRTTPGTVYELLGAPSIATQITEQTPDSHQLAARSSQCCSKPASVESDSDEQKAHEDIHEEAA